MHHHDLVYFCIQNSQGTRALRKQVLNDLNDCFFEAEKKRDKLLLWISFLKARKICRLALKTKQEGEEIGRIDMTVDVTLHTDKLCRGSAVACAGNLLARDRAFCSSHHMLRHEGQRRQLSCPQRKEWGEAVKVEDSGEVCIPNFEGKLNTTNQANLIIK